MRQVGRAFLGAAVVMVWACASALAEPMSNRFFTNDALGDGHDRWHSGSYTLFWSWAQAPAALGSTWLSERGLDLHLRSQIISPWTGAGQDQRHDRPFAEMIGLGATAVETRGRTQLSFGAELVFMGEQTGLSRLQRRVHQRLGLKAYDRRADVRRAIDNALSGAVFAEIARGFDLGGQAQLRPFAALHAGYETYLRVGGDILWGEAAGARRFVRDPATGLLKPSLAPFDTAGPSWLLGADLTAVAQSDLFPEWSPVEMERLRHRLRLGLRTGANGVAVFYGVTYLGTSFRSQAEGQLVGTLSFDLRF